MSHREAMQSDEEPEAIEPASPSRRGVSRRERQHLEIVALMLKGDADRARALGAEHLAEFPDDTLIRQLTT